MVKKICRLCKKEIITKEDNYVRLTDYKRGEKVDEGFYHNICFHEKIDNTITRNKDQMRLKLSEVMNKLKGGESPLIPA